MKPFIVFVVFVLLIGCSGRVGETYTLPIGIYNSDVGMYYTGMVTPNVFSIGGGHLNVFLNSNRNYFLYSGGKYEIIKVTPDTLVIKKLD